MPTVALLGIGKWGRNHMRVLLSEGVDLFIVEPSQESREDALSLGVSPDRLFERHDEVMDEVEAAFIVTPAETHFDLSRTFLEQGKDVFVEKPLTLDSRQARALLELAEAKDLLLQVGHIFRYDPASQWLHQALQDGAFGEPRILRGKFSGFKRPRHDSGVAFADGVHFIDLFNYLLGRPPGKVQAFLHDFLDRGMDDAALISMEYDMPGGPVWATVEANYFEPGKYREALVVGDKSAALCDFNVAQYKVKTFLQTHTTAPDGRIRAEEGAVHQKEFPPAEPLLLEIRAFLSSIVTREQPLADGLSGWHAVRVLEAAMESARTGVSVSL